MGDNMTLLITILNGDELVRVALRVDHYPTPEYYMEPEERETIYNLLPEYIRDLGPIVEIQPILEVYHIGTAGMGR